MKKDITLDLDFSDVTGKESAEVETKESPKKIKKKKKAKKKQQGIMLSIPQEDGTFRSVNMRDCDNEEFTEWANSLYPDLIEDPDEVEKPMARMRVLKYIMQAHTSEMYTVKAPDAKLKN
jgi:hypothetical protein